MGAIEPIKQKSVEWVNQESLPSMSEGDVGFDLPKEGGAVVNPQTVQHSLDELSKAPMPKVLGTVAEAVRSGGKGKLLPGSVIVTAGLISPTHVDLSRTLRALFHRAVEGGGKE